MSAQYINNAGVYTDMASLQSLKGKVKAADHESIKEVAKQFEAVMLQMMLSSMRSTVQTDEAFSNEKKTYFDMFDKQIAMELADRGGIGIAKLMMRDLQQGVDGKQKEDQDISVSKNQAVVNPLAVRAMLHQQQRNINSDQVSASDDMSVRSKDTEKPDISARTDNVNKSAKEDLNDNRMLDASSPRAFISSLWNIAKDIIVDSGLDPKAVIAQAALETGWGKHIISQNGKSSHNLFGIKSNPRWDGDTVVAKTLEFDGTAMRQQREGFRAYESIRDSIRDYVDFLSKNQRYQTALDNTTIPEKFAVELQKAGYATDPDYASKIINIMKREEFSEVLGSNEI